MHIASIIAEYNPFHLGHQWQIQKTREQLGADCPVIAIMSGHWVQGASPSITDKWTRAHLALLGGVDLALELPLPYALSSAESFARGAIRILSATGLPQTLSFGSELGELQPLQEVAQTLDRPQYPQLLQEYLTQGISFPSAREKAIGTLLGTETTPLANPNNNLGIEYLRGINAIAPHFSAITIKRRGAGHQSHGVVDGFASATQIRQHLSQGNWPDAAPLMPPESLPLLKEAQRSDFSLCHRAILYALRTMTVDQWSALPDSGEKEGLPVRLYQCAQQATSVDEFLTLAKTKRYTHARLRRMLLWAFLGVTHQHQTTPPPYIRVLGANPTGRTLLREMKSCATLPIITNPKEVRTMSPEAQTLFDLESHATDLYALTLEHPWPCGEEWKRSPVILE